MSVRVASNLLNRLRTVDPTGYAARTPQDYGLLGPVSLQALDRQAISTPIAPTTPSNPTAAATTTKLKVKPVVVKVGSTKRAVAIVKIRGAKPQGAAS